ncbi:MAG: quinohemoprotein amine dehydrogenase subunit beta [Rhodospirillaceae bacterium]|nr:quinohemoprotein amine dehydrogenase subunit beta [Rhodospirillaceae bacterium]
MTTRLGSLLAGAAMVIGVGAATVGVAQAKDFIITATKPNNLFVVDMAERKVVSECQILGRGSPISMAPSPTSNVVFVSTNGWGEVSGVDTDTCEEVFHADLSEGNIRARNIAAMTISRDGKELYVQQTRVELLPDRYNILPHRIAVYDTDAGLDATPKRTFEVPRGISIMTPSVDGKYLWAGGHDAYQIEIATGKIVNTVPILNWERDRPTYGKPDALAFWPLYEQTEVMVLPYFAPKFASEKQEEMVDFVVGTTRIDLTDNTWVQEDLTSADVLIFSMSLNPSNTDIIYGVYTQLSKYNVATKELEKRIDLDHTFYSVNVSSDGKEVYVGSTNDDIGVYDAETLEKLAIIKLPGGGDQGALGFRMVQR